MYEKLKEAVVLLLQRVAQPMALENSIQKPVKQDFCLDANLLPVSVLVLVMLMLWKKLRSTLDATEINLGKIKEQ